MTQIQFTMELPDTVADAMKAPGYDKIVSQKAIFLRPYIDKGLLSHGKAAELIGMNKLDLIFLYGELGYAYFDMNSDELEADIRAAKGQSI